MRTTVGFEKGKDQHEINDSYSVNTSWDQLGWESGAQINGSPWKFKQPYNHIVPVAGVLLYAYWFYFYLLLEWAKFIELYVPWLNSKQNIMTFLSLPALLAIFVAFYVSWWFSHSSMVLSQAADGKVETEKKREGVGVVERLTKMMCWVGG